MKPKVSKSSKATSGAQRREPARESQGLGQETELSELPEQQNGMIIALLARSILGVEAIREIVEYRKKGDKRKAYVKAYNALDGTKTNTQVAKVSGVSESTMRGVLEGWEKQGIVFRAEKGRGGKYVGLLKLPLTAGKSKRDAIDITARGRTPPSSDR